MCVGYMQTPAMLCERFEHPHILVAMGAPRTHPPAYQGMTIYSHCALTPVILDEPASLVKADVSLLPVSFLSLPLSTLLPYFPLLVPCCLFRHSLSPLSSIFPHQLLLLYLLRGL